MTPITRILVPVDLSSRSLGTASYASSLAAGLGSELIFLHALQHGWPLPRKGREIRDRIRAMAGPNPFLFREGPPAPVILHAAEAERVDLIVLSTRGKPAVTRLLGKSIAVRVLREARCPVLVGRDRQFPSFDKRIRSVLCGLSLGPRTSSVLRWSANVATRLDATLSLTHASAALEPNPHIPCDCEWRRWLKEMTREQIWDIQRGVGTDAGVWLQPGSPLATIPHLAGHLQADLLVIGKSPRKRLLGDARMLSYAIACRTPCPVASV